MQIRHLKFKELLTGDRGKKIKKKRSYNGSVIISHCSDVVETG